MRGDRDPALPTPDRPSPELGATAQPPPICASRPPVLTLSAMERRGFSQPVSKFSAIQPNRKLHLSNLYTIEHPFQAILN